MHCLITVPDVSEKAGGPAEHRGIGTGTMGQGKDLRGRCSGGNPRREVPGDLPLPVYERPTAFGPHFLPLEV